MYDESLLAFNIPGVFINYRVTIWDITVGTDFLYHDLVCLRNDSYTLLSLIVSL